MKGKTRAYNNQWLIKTSNHIDLALFNLTRIFTSVTAKGKYPLIIENIESSMLSLIATKLYLTTIQELFNDPRANKIEV